MASSGKHIRSPIISVLGHVDHGKTSLLDAVRGSNVADKEAGRITQMVGASYISIDSIKRTVDPIKDMFKTDLLIPGLLFIDTPGHEAFSSLRERGGSISDMAILVIDVLQGIQPQTIESIKILQEYKTPFVIAANKIDAIDGWRDTEELSFLRSFNGQQDYVKQALDDKIYNIMGKLSEYNINSERFDRIKDFTKEFAIIPLSAKTKVGLAELLMMISGMSQKYLEKELYISDEDPVKGTVIEVKELKGLGTTVDVIIYDGILKKGDTMIFITQDGTMKTKIRGLVIKTDSLGSAEALLRLLKEKSIPISKVGIGPVSREDIMFAKSMGHKNKFFNVVLAFNVKMGKEIASISEAEKVKIVWSDIIYRVIDDYQQWKSDEEIRLKNNLKNEIAFPASIKVMGGDYFFRISDPAVFGVEVLKGTLKPGVQLMDRKGNILGEVKGIQDKNVAMPEAPKGSKMAISVSGITLKKDINGNENLLTFMSRHEINLWKDNIGLLNDEERELFREIEMLIIINNIAAKAEKGGF
ncbi:MAG: GTP-binding protein [Candidatus Micrarchaeota archaeon]|nr:GTP-binding protein [Candidatus Micrarchaeota archaeon]